MNEPDPYASPQMAYNRHVLDWRQDVLEFEEATEAAAIADAAHKAAWSKAVILAKRQDPKLSVDIVKAIADADDDVATLAMTKLITEAKVTSTRKKLDWDAAYADNLRTQVVNERLENSFGSQAGAGAGRTTFDGPPTETIGRGAGPTSQAAYHRLPPASREPQGGEGWYEPPTPPPDEPEPSQSPTAPPVGTIY